MLERSLEIAQVLRGVEKGHGDRKPSCTYFATLPEYVFFFVWALVSADFVCHGVLGVALFVHTCHVYCFITSINLLID